MIFAAFYSFFKVLIWAVAEILMNMFDPTGHLGLPHSSKDIFWIAISSSDLGQLWCFQAPLCLWVVWKMLWSSRFTTRPEELCQHTARSPHLTPLAQKTLISKGRERLQLLVCMNEFNFYTKRLQVVIVNSCLKPGIVWTQTNVRNETCLCSDAAKSACCKCSELYGGLQTPGLVFSITAVCL